MRQSNWTPKDPVDQTCETCDHRNKRPSEAPCNTCVPVIDAETGGHGDGRLQA